MKYLRFAGVLLMASVALIYAVALPGFTQNEIMHEQTRSYIWGGDVDVHINAPGKDSLKADKETIICFYALPAGNTIEWTIGKQMEEGDDWHFDIQHIGAQTRFLRHTLKDKNFITIYIQPTTTSWSGYDDIHPSTYHTLIQNMTHDILAQFSGLNYKVTLNSHSAGGSWVLRYMEGVNEIPEWINRLAFIDSDYNYRYNADYYDPMFDSFLNDRDSTYMCVMAYNDSTALLDGQHFIGIGGTWCTTKLMKSRLENYFTFQDSHDVDFYRYLALDNRFEILMKTNPAQAILHTVQVYKNGFIHSMLNGTEYENVGYEYYGMPAYLEYIQGNPPARPEGVAAFGSGQLDISIKINAVDDATGYRVYLSEDGINMIDTVMITGSEDTLSGLSFDKTYFLRVSAINQWGESELSEWLGVTSGDKNSTMLMVNAVNRSYGHDYLLRHGKALQDNLARIASCTNSMIINGSVNLSNYEMVNYVIGNESRSTYPLVAEEIDSLKRYLQQGGFLYMSGLEIAYALDIKGDSIRQDFCQNFLKLKGISDKPNNQSSTYYNAAFEGFNFFNYAISFEFDNGSHGSYNVGDPDGIVPVNGSYRSVVFTGYDPNISCAGVAYSGDFPEGILPGKVFVMTIPFETIVSDTMRSMVMGEILRFLYWCDADVESLDIPKTTKLHVPYPNPFNPRTAINIQLSSISELELSIFNLRGQKIHTLFSGTKEAGEYTFNWNAENFSSGVYLCVMKVDGKIFDSKKMVLVK